MFTGHPESSDDQDDPSAEDSKESYHVKYSANVNKDNTGLSITPNTEGPGYFRDPLEVLGL